MLADPLHESIVVSQSSEIKVTELIERYFIKFELDALVRILVIEKIDLCYLACFDPCSLGNTGLSICSRDLNCTVSNDY